jgi:hypothetical protein
MSSRGSELDIDWNHAPEGTGWVNRDFGLRAGRYMHCRIAPHAPRWSFCRRKADAEVKNAEETPMPGKSKMQRGSEKKKHAPVKKGIKKTAGLNRQNSTVSRPRAVEPSSGAESSSLDPKRKVISVPEEYSVPITSGQLSGDVQGLPQEDLDDSESVEELVEEGQDLEGELVQGVENAPPADRGDVRTHAPPEPEERTPDYKNRNRL